MTEGSHMVLALGLFPWLFLRALLPKLTETLLTGTCKETATQD